MRKNIPKIFSNRGFTLIELLVAMFIFLMVMGAMVAVSVAIFRSYQKSKAIKTVSEEVGFALNSIAKDVRMGSIEKSASFADGGRKDTLMVTRNRTQQKVCYKISGAQMILYEGTNSNCTGGSTTKTLVDLTGTNMTFDVTTGFRSCPSAIFADITQDPGYYACPSASSAEMRRGWAEVNLNVENPSMETDSIRVQVIVSTRDYGWEETP